MVRHAFSLLAVLVVATTQGCLAYSPEVPGGADVAEWTPVTSATVSLRFAERHLGASGEAIAASLPPAAVEREVRRLVPGARLNATEAPYVLDVSIKTQDRTCNAFLRWLWIQTLFVSPIWLDTEVTATAKLYDARGQEIAATEAMASRRLVASLLLLPLAPVNFFTMRTPHEDALRACLAELATSPAWR